MEYTIRKTLEKIRGIVPSLITNNNDNTIVALKRRKNGGRISAVRVVAVTDETFGGMRQTAGVIRSARRYGNITWYRV